MDRTRHTGYVYDAASQLRVETVGTSHVIEYLYDADGRRTDRRSGGIREVTTFDERGLPTSSAVQQAGNAAIVIEQRSYDGDARLTSVRTRAPGAVALSDNALTWDPTEEVPEIAAMTPADGAGTTFVHVAGGPSAAVGADRGPLARDHLGSVMQTTVGGQGSLWARGATYDSFGNPVGGPGRVGPTLGYRGEMHTPAGAAGTLHLRNRDYDPRTATFTTVDPMLGVEGMTTVANTYHYANNDPLNQTDPLGLRPSDEDFEYVDPGCGPGEEERQGEVATLTGPQIGYGCFPLPLPPPPPTAFDQMIDRLWQIRDLVQPFPGWAHEEAFVNMAAASLAGLTSGFGGNWYFPERRYPWDDPVFGDEGGEIRGSSGWNSAFIDEDESPARHFIGWFAVGYHRGSSYAKAALRAAEQGDAGTQQDIRAGEAAISIGVLLSWGGVGIDDAISMIVGVAGGSHPGGRREREAPGSPWCVLTPTC